MVISCLHILIFRQYLIKKYRMSATFSFSKN